MTWILHWCPWITQTNLAWGANWTYRASNTSIDFSFFLPLIFTARVNTDSSRTPTSGPPHGFLCLGKTCTGSQNHWEKSSPLGICLAVKDCIGWIVSFLWKSIKQIKSKGTNACLYLCRKARKPLCLHPSFEVLPCPGFSWCSAVPTCLRQTIMPDENIAQLSNLLHISTTSA